MKNATTRALHAYWDRLRAGRAAPERGDLDPGAIRTLLGDVFLLEMDGQARHTVRLAGTRICTLLGHEWKGRPFDGPFPDGDRREIHKLLDGVCAAAAPVVAGVTGETADGRQIDLELLMLPLRHRGRTHARLRHQSLGPIAPRPPSPSLPPATHNIQGSSAAAVWAPAFAGAQGSAGVDLRPGEPVPACSDIADLRPREGGDPKA